MYVSAKSFADLDERVAYVPDAAGRIALRVVDDEAWGLVPKGALAPQAAVALDLLESGVHGTGSPPNTWLTAMDEPDVVRLPPLVGGQAESWPALIEIAPQLGHHWLLIGGQMVFLHEVERESTDVRPTNDIDLVVDLRVEPAALGHTHSVLARAGFSQDLPSPEGVAHRYRRGEATIDVLAPDHIGARATLALGSGRTIEAPGTSQAFCRVSLVRVELDNNTAAIVRRTTLIGAQLGKATAVTEIVSMSSAFDVVPRH